MSTLRDAHGVFHVRAAGMSEAFRELGRCHAVDRGLQMLLMRILGRGRAAELLKNTPELLEADVFFRRMNWGAPDPDLDALSPDTQTACTAYCEGVNHVFRRKVPWELRLLGYRPEPWTLDDILLLSRLSGYLTLAQSQGEMERLLVEWVQQGVPRELLEELFPGQLGSLDVELIRKVRLGDRLLPPALLAGSPLPRLMASNSWVVAGSRTASGKPILANDPHLEINRLPSVWYEVALSAPGLEVAGATIPGLPAILVGRSRSIAWGMTYSFMDAVDSWIEHCRGGKFRRGDHAWHPFRTRREVIRRKDAEEVVRIFHENDHGVLDGDPGPEGYLLSTRWSAGRAGARSIDAFHQLLKATTVQEAMERACRIETAWSFVFADTTGSIGFQMSGRLPKRREGASGLVPLPGWDPRNDWAGFHDPTELPRALNPEQGYFVTANHDLNAWGRAPAINLPMGPYRAERITELLQGRKGLTTADMAAIQRDLHSRQADAFLRILRPLLPDTPAGRSLGAWNGDYDAGSEAPFLFEEIYRDLIREVFGPVLGRELVDHLWTRSGIFIDFYLNFDRVLLSGEPRWFGGRPRDAVFRQAVDAALARPSRRWGETRRVTMKHLLLGGRLPRWLGFDRGPIELPGGRATISQGQIYRSGGRETTFAPSLRVIADLAESSLHTSLCGGPSDRRFSRWYASEIRAWERGLFKAVLP